jgi:glutamate/tyrosine decarboxylase-like PLP-dependent enzyme
LQSELVRAGSRDVKWREGRAAVYVFNSGEDVMQVAHDAYGMFIAENGLGPAAFPSLKRMEQEVVEMALSLQHAPDGAAGSMTSGGTESILLAMKSCRDWSQDHRPVPGKPKVVVPYSAHPAFNKGAHLMGLEVVRVPLRADFTADMAAMAAAVDSRTIMIVGSAPCFPYGVIDPVPELSTLAAERGLWLHVDACVGGYLSPFMRQVREERQLVPLTSWDFSNPGVASMSLDLHKYGYAAKGASTVLYRDKSMHEAQIFDFADWPCGRMTTPTFAGTRPGGAIAAAWAVMHYLGFAGYLARARRIDAVRERIAGFCRDNGLTVHGDPQLSIIAFGDPSGDILAAGDGLYRAGWFSSRVRRPDGIQVMLSPEHDKVVDTYLDEVLRQVQRARREGARSSGEVRYS